jgi:hypothetical protein
MNLKKTEVIMRSFKVSVVRSMIVMVAMLMLGTSTFAQVSVTLPNVSGVAGTTGSGAITVGNLTGQNVTAFSFQISYNKSLYYITGADNNNTLVGTTLTVNPDTANGKILVAWAGATALTGSGNLVNLNFKFRQQGQQALSFDNFIFNAGTPAVTLVNNGLITIPQVIIQGGTIAARVGEKIMIPITISQVTTAENVRSYDFVATFDPSMIKINGYSLTGTLSNGSTPAINIDSTAGTIKFAWASSNQIVTNGDTLLYLTGTAIKVGTANINFTAFELNQGSPLVGANAASVTITLNYAPTLTFSPVAPYSVNEGATLSITLVGADQNSTDVSSLKYTITVPTSLPSGAKLTGNIFSWTPNFNAGRQAAYSFTFKVTDVYGASSTSTISITVVNVDRAPIFTSVLPPNQIAVVNKPTPVIYSFQYEASDPDGDVVTYSLSSGPAGSSIDPNTGLFTWGPTSDQVGQMYTVTVKATDGTLTTKTSQTIAASTTITGVARVNTMPTEYNLSQNYPNPFNPTTSIQFSIPKESFVKLSVFNVIGQRIQVLVNQNMSAGNYKVNFDASKLNSGMYIYRIETADYTSVRKMLLVK